MATQTTEGQKGASQAPQQEQEETAAEQGGTQMARREGGGLGQRRGERSSPWGSELLGFPLMRRMMEDFAPLLGGLGGVAPLMRGEWTPQVEVFRRGAELVVKADLPGIEEKDIHVDIADDVLTLEGERRAEHEESEEGYFRSERSYGSFRRSLSLPDGVDLDSVTARFKNGVLEVSMKVQEQEQRSRRIQIQSGQGEAKKPQARH